MIIIINIIRTRDPHYITGNQYRAFPLAMSTLSALNECYALSYSWPHLSSLVNNQTTQHHRAMQTPAAAVAHRPSVTIGFTRSLYYTVIQNTCLNIQLIRRSAISIYVLYCFNLHCLFVGVTNHFGQCAQRHFIFIERTVTMFIIRVLISRRVRQVKCLQQTRRSRCEEYYE